MSFSAEQCVIITNFCFQFLLSTSYSCYLFGEFAEVLILTGKSDAYNKLICIVEPETPSKFSLHFLPRDASVDNKQATLRRIPKDKRKS